MRGDGHGDRGTNGKQSILSDDGHQTSNEAVAALGVVIGLTVLTFCSAVILVCFCKSPKHEELETAEAPLLLQDLNSNDPPNITHCSLLSPNEELFAELKHYFTVKWKSPAGEVVSSRREEVPEIKDIWQVDAQNHLNSYLAKRYEIDEEPGYKHGYAAGNEKSRFFGAKIKCDFQGRLCRGYDCSVCRILEQGSFESPCIQSEIRFNGSSRAAMHRGRAPNGEDVKSMPTECSDQSQSPVVGTTGNAGVGIFFADVLVGTPEVVESDNNMPLPPGTHSRVIMTGGIDELIIFESSQAIPKALILFR